MICAVARVAACGSPAIAPSATTKNSIGTVGKAARSPRRWGAGGLQEEQAGVLHGECHRDASGGRRRARRAARTFRRWAADRAAAAQAA
ncbi:hypothetical protein GCM10023405_06610 [Streptomonospora salina]